MIAKIVTGKSFGGAVRYLMEKSGHARIIDSDGVELSDIRSLIGSFNFQRKARPEKAEVVGHISLSFHKDDKPRLTDGFMAGLAREYMQRMGITDTQYIVVRHTDTEHPHLHILYNRVRYDTKLVRSHNERIRSVAVCKAMKQKYGLTFSEGKENVKIERLHDPDKVKYRIYEAVKAILPYCVSLPELAERLLDKGIETTFIHRGGDPAKGIQGITFTKENLTFKASQVDRKFSYANLCKIIEANRAERERQETEQTQRQMQSAQTPVPESITEIRGMKLTAEQQKRLYSPQGLTCRYEENNTSLFRVKNTFGRDILTEELLSQEKIKRNPIIFGVRLTDEQVEQIKDGQPVYLEGMQYDGKTFNGYLVMDDNLTRERAYIGHDPREWVEYGKYTMRRMDRDLIKAVLSFVPSFNGGEDTGRLQGRTCGKRIHRTKRIKKVGTILANPERSDTIQNRERSCHPPRNLKARSYNGRPETKSPFHPNAKVWIEGISCKAIQSVLTGRPCSLSLRSHGLVANGWNGTVCGMSKGWKGL